jgi:hypothetical protein
VESSSEGSSGDGGRGLIDPGGHYLEDDEESPGVYVCDPCRITVIQNVYPVQERTGTVCGNCGAEVVEGLDGGYVCRNCYYTVPPKGEPKE